jgi:hypothetical protein
MMREIHREVIELGISNLQDGVHELSNLLYEVLKSIKMPHQGTEATNEARRHYAVEVRNAEQSWYQVH